MLLWPIMFNSPIVDSTADDNNNLKTFLERPLPFLQNHQTNKDSTKCLAEIYLTGARYDVRVWKLQTYFGFVTETLPQCVCNCSR